MKILKKIALVLSAIPLLVLAYHSWWLHESYDSLLSYYPRFSGIIYLYSRIIVIFQLLFYLFLFIKWLKQRFLYAIPIQILHKPLFRKIMYGIIFVIAAFLRFGINNPPLLLDPDFSGYLEPALQLMNGKEFGLTIRSYPYPLFCFGILSMFKHIDAILYVQHILALITLICSFLFLEKLIDKTSIVKIKEVVCFLGIIFIVACFWYGNIIVLEKTLRPEGIVLPTLFLVFYLLYQYYQASKNHIYSFVRLISLVFVSLILAYLHPRMSLAFYFTVFIVIGHFLYFSNYRFQSKVIATIVLALVSCVVIIPELYLIKNYEENTNTFAYKQFYFSNLYGINEAMDQGESILSDFDKTTMKEIITETLNNSSFEKSFPILKYDLDVPQYELFPIAFNKYNNNRLERVKSNGRKIIDDKLQELSYENRESTYQDTVEVLDKLKALHNDLNTIMVVDNVESYYFKSWFWLMIQKYPHKVAYKTGKQLIYLFFDFSTSYLSATGLDFQCKSFNRESEEFQFLCKELKFNPDKVYFYKPPSLFDSLIVLFGYFLKILMIIIIPFYFIQLIKKKLNLFDFLVGAFFLITVFTIAFLHTLDLVRYRASFFPVLMLFVTLGSYKLLSQIFFKNKINNI